jgi:hypothetical protein
VTVDVGEHGWVGARGLLPRAAATAAH